MMAGLSKDADAVNVQVKTERLLMIIFLANRLWVMDKEY